MAGTSAQPIDPLQDLVASLKKEFGSDRVGLASEILKPIQRVPTGCLALDAMLGGGFPMGRITEIAGSAGCGKTTLALFTAANAQKLDPNARVVIVSAEGALSPHTLQLAGIDPDRAVIVYPMEYGEKTMDVLHRYYAGAFSRGVPITAVVIDSLAALVPYLEVESTEKHGLEGQTVGAHARLAGKVLRAIIGPLLSRGDAAFLVINQFRSQISTVPLPDRTTGGRAVEYFPKLRLNLRTSPSKRVRASELVPMAPLSAHISTLPDFSRLPKDEWCGHDVEVEVSKSSLYPPKQYARTTFRVIYGHGYDNIRATVELGDQLGVLVRTGNYYTYGGLKVQGLYPFVVRAIEEGVWATIEQAVRDRIIHTISMPAISEEPTLITEDDPW